MSDGIEQYMPTWHVRSRHQVLVNAPAEITYAALRGADLGTHPIVRIMLGLRALPAAILSAGLGDLRERAARPITLTDLEQHGFRTLADQPPRSLVLGLEGAFWRPGGGLRQVDPQTFTGPVPRGVSRAAWSFTVEPVTSTECRLLTETRVLSGGQAARRWFRLYWSCIGWASSLIRRLMLRAIRAEAEARARSRGRPDR